MSAAMATLLGSGPGLDPGRSGALLAAMLLCPRLIEPCLLTPAEKPNAPAVKRDAEEGWGGERWR